MQTNNRDMDSVQLSLKQACQFYSFFDSLKQQQLVLSPFSLHIQWDISW